MTFESISMLIFDVFAYFVCSVSHVLVFIYVSRVCLDEAGVECATHLLNKISFTT